MYAERNQGPALKRLADAGYWHDRWYKAKRSCIPTGPYAVYDDQESAQPEQSAGPPGKHRAPGGLIESLTAKRYRDLFGQHAVTLLQAAETVCDLEACCRLGLLLICVGRAKEGEAWLSVAADGADDPMARALLLIPPHRREGTELNRQRLAAECLYDMALSEGIRRKKTLDTSPEDWIELYLDIADRGGHPDAAYQLAIRHRARGNDEGAAYWFTRAARSGHPAARGRFEMIYREMRDGIIDE